MSTPWTPSEVKRAVALYREGNSAAEIAKVIGRTRNAVIGRMGRMGLHLAGKVVGKFVKTPAQIAQMRSLRSAGLSLSATARIVGCSRSTVEKHTGWQPKQQPSSPTLIQRKPRTATLHVLKPRPLPEVAPMPETAPVARPDGLIGLLELKHDTCRYPFGDVPNIGFCGKHPKVGSPYCLEHHKITHSRPTAEDRAKAIEAVKFWKRSA